MTLPLEIPDTLYGDWAFMGYIALVAAAALSLCYLDEKKSSQPSLSATVYPLAFPDESIPWSHFDRVEFFATPLGLGLSKIVPPFLRAKVCSAGPGSGRVVNADDIHLALSTRLHAYLGYALLTLTGFIREAFWTVSLKKSSSHHKEAWNSIWWKEFFTQHMYRRIEECWGRPISGSPSREVRVCIRERPNSGFISQMFHGFLPFRLTGEERTCINMASYNYLGFGGIDKECTPACVAAIRKYGISVGGCRSDGSLQLHYDLEKEIATFLGKEDAIVMGMGFATNSTLIPAVVCDEFGSAKNVLIISDELNHKSIVEGCRLSGATIRSFKHSDMEFLDEMLAVETRKKIWSKIFIFVEGVYSMEGGYCKIREIVRLRSKYGVFVWLDEAHSIGAVGATGRGVTELFQVPTSHIDVLMGTFTKSFGSAGGYICGSRALMAQVRSLSVGWTEASAMTPLCAAQALSSFKAMQSPRGLKKIQQLRDNSDYFRNQLVQLGCRVVGDLHSPVVCAMLVHPEKIYAFSQECLKRNLAVVVVGFPATPVLLSRVRFCLSAAHSQRDLDKVIATLSTVVDLVGIKYAEGEDPVDVDLLMQLAMAVSLVDTPIDYWKSDPLVTDASNSTPPPVFASKGKIDAQKHDPLGLLQIPPECIVSAALARLNEVGCGTCGPRGFYGTTTDHLVLEKTISDFLGTESAIVYSHHVSTASSVIPAFIKKDDLVLLRSNPLGTAAVTASGIRLSRAANVSVWTSPADLETLLSSAASMLRTDPYFRIWILCEGGVGHLDLKRVVELKLAFGAYLLLDDTFCVGATGASGRGSVERCGVSIKDVDILIGSLEHAFSAVGGFVAGRADIIEHQRLYGDGYCFSASAPASLTVAAYKAIEFLQTDPGKARLDTLQGNIEMFVSGLKKILDIHAISHETLLSSKSSYMQIIKLPGEFRAEKFVTDISSNVRAHPMKVSLIGLNLLRKFQTNGTIFDNSELVRINLSAAMSPADIATILKDIDNIFKRAKRPSLATPPITP